MAIRKACKFSNELKNTGKECDIAMGPTALLIAVPPSLKFSNADLEDPIGWITPLMHGASGVRVFPFFGNKAPITAINNNKENDVMATLDNGSTVFIRYGFTNRVFDTISGGLCYAKALQSLNASGYSIIEVDQFGKMLVRQNDDDTYSGLNTNFMYSPAPTFGDFSNPFKNHFQLSYNPQEYVNYGVILDGAEVFLSLMGLIDAEIVDAEGTTTHIDIGVETECAETDLVALFGSAWESTTLFRVTNKDTGAVVVLSGITIVDGKLRLAGVFVDGETYVVEGTTAAALLAVDIEGYEIVKSAEVTI